MRSETVDLGYFERLYEKNADPWRFASSAYERDKYAATLAALPRPRYGRALDVGCSIGVFTAALAERCDDLLAIEPVEVALAEARARNADRSWVRFTAMFVPGEWPDERFDLIVLSEVIDYLGLDDLTALVDRLRASLEPGGDVVLVHWLGKKTGPAKTEEASDRLIASARDFLAVSHAARNADYRLDVLRRF